MTDTKTYRPDSARAGVLALQHLLGQIIKAPHAFAGDEKLLTALKTQRGLAGLNRAAVLDNGDTLNCSPCSLNTLKKYSDEVLIGGFNTLDALRSKAIEAIERHERKVSRSNKRTKEGLKLKVADHELELDMLRQTNFLLLRALQEAMGQIKSISKQSDSLTREKWASDAISTMLAITSLAIPPFNLTAVSQQTKTTSSKVTNINEHRK